MVKLVHNRKWNLIKTRQELNRSYKEICIPLLEKCRFLLYEVKPAVSVEMEAFKKVNVLYKEPRVKTLVKKVIKDLKCGRHTSEIQKPEDIVNATIQSQSLERYKSNEDLTKSNTKLKPDDDINNEIRGNISDSINSTASKHEQQKIQKNCTDLKTELEGKWNVEKTAENDAEQMTDDQVKEKLENDIALSNKIFKLTEKRMKKVCMENIGLINSILDFVTQESNCDIDIIRKAMYCQVKRSKIRRDGLEMIKHLLNETYLLTSVRYSMCNGYLGISYFNKEQSIFHCLDNVQLITPNLKTEILLSQWSVTEWCIEKLRHLILKDLPNRTSKQKVSNAKINLNLGTYTLLRDVPRARMLLVLLGILSSNHYISIELYPLINSGVISSVLSLLRQTGSEQNVSKKGTELHVLYADMIQNSKPKTNTLNGPELATLMKLNTRVVRGVDWKWGDQVRYMQIVRFSLIKIS